MAISLFDATVPNYLQLIRSLRGVLDKGMEYATSTGMKPEVLVEARLIDDMFPLWLQIQRVADHSIGALRDVSNGAFSMPPQHPIDYPGLMRLLAETETGLMEWDREEVNALEGREVIFDTGSYRTSFTAEAFLFSFSLPNFYFHAVTAYDILRTKGVPIGKRDYLGQTRTKIG